MLGRTAAVGLAFWMALGAGPVGAQLLGQSDEGTPDAGGVPEGTTAVELAPLGYRVWRVPGFDPVEDVPAMRNWVGAIETSGSGNCYAMSVLTSYFFQKIEFVREPGLPFEEWKTREADSVEAMPPLAADEKGLKLLALWLSTDGDEKLKIGGFAGLNDFTSGGPTEARFRELAEAIQFTMQIPNDLGRYGGSIVKSALGFLPVLPLGPDEVNKDGFHVIRDRVAEGRPVPITMHPSGLAAEGHVIVVYEVRESDDKVEMYAYDCNFPPDGEDPDPAVLTLFKDDGWRYEVRHDDGQRRYASWNLLTVPDPDGSRGRRIFRDIATNYGEHLERMDHLGDLVSEGRSPLTRLKGLAGFVGEVLNPF